MAVYYATKSYVLSFSKGLARELEGSGVSVTALSPGVTKSSFEDRAALAGPGCTLLFLSRPRRRWQA